MTSADFTDFRGRRMADFMALANLRFAPLSCETISFNDLVGARKMIREW
jgi:hypothetical protein